MKICLIKFLNGVITSSWDGIAREDASRAAPTMRRMDPLILDDQLVVKN